MFHSDGLVPLIDKCMDCIAGHQKMYGTMVHLFLHSPYGHWLAYQCRVLNAVVLRLTAVHNSANHCSTQGRIRANEM